MTYLDTGCFVKLYYPEADSVQVIAKIQGKAICHTPLHELEFVNALQLQIVLEECDVTAGERRASVSRGRFEVGLARSGGW